MELKSTLWRKKFTSNGDDGSQIHIDENGRSLSPSRKEIKQKLQVWEFPIHEHGKDRILINKERDESEN